MIGISEILVHQSLKQLKMWGLKTFLDHLMEFSSENIKRNYYCLVYGKVIKECRGRSTHGLSSRLAYSSITEWPQHLLSGDLQLPPDRQYVIQTSSTYPHFLLNSICFWVIKSSQCKPPAPGVTSLPGCDESPTAAPTLPSSCLPQLPWPWACPGYSTRPNLSVTDSFMRLETILAL